MNLKPRNTVFNERAKVFKRYLSMEEVRNKRVVYKTIDNKYWLFDYVQEVFVETTYNNEPNIKFVDVPIYYEISFNGKYYKYNRDTATWGEVKTTALSEVIKGQGGNTARYQVNKYFYAGTMDYIIKGSVEGTATQWIVGNALPLSSLNIQYYDDGLILGKDDLVVIGKRLFCVEDTEAVQKRQPRPYFIYSSTLNNIL